MSDTSNTRPNDVDDDAIVEQFPDPFAGPEGSHSADDEGGPGGIVNYPESLYPEGWTFTEGESSPVVEPDAPEGDA